MDNDSESDPLSELRQQSEEKSTEASEERIWEMARPIIRRMKELQDQADYAINGPTAELSEPQDNESEKK